MVLEAGTFGARLPEISIAGSSGTGPLAGGIGSWYVWGQTPSRRWWHREAIEVSVLLANLH